LELDVIYNEDCIGEKGMCILPDKSIDMILCDLPYGTTACKWDIIIPFEPLWEQYKRIIKNNGAIVLTASQPFTSKLVMSNLKMFKYEWIWEKSNPSNISQADRMPLKYHENILVFYNKLPTYNKQLIKRIESGKRIIKKYQKRGVTFKHGATEHNQKNRTDEYDANRYNSDFKNPKTVIYFKSERCHPRLHPTQKPVALFEYLIKTYTNKDDLVLDNCMGSGTTAVACKQLGRHYIGFEINKEYYKIAKQRLVNIVYQEKLNL